MNETGSSQHISAEAVPLEQRAAEAMAAKRRELIAQPLERIWPDLARAAIAAMPGEPVAWVFETFSGKVNMPHEDWITQFSVQKPAETVYRRHIRPLYAAPAMPANPPSFVQEVAAWEVALGADALPATDTVREQITEILADEVNVSDVTLAAAGGVAMLDFGKAIERLAALSHPSQGGWQPIETAPKDGTPVLLGFPHYAHSMHGHYEDGIWGQLTSDFGFEHLPTQPTHWMPLPPAPPEVQP